jgi:hypothetical protein
MRIVKSARDELDILSACRELINYRAAAELCGTIASAHPTLVVAHLQLREGGIPLRATTVRLSSQRFGARPTQDDGERWHVIGFAPCLGGSSPSYGGFCGVPSTLSQAA